MRHAGVMFCLLIGLCVVRNTAVTRAADSVSSAPSGSAAGPTGSGSGPAGSGSAPTGSTAAPMGSASVPGGQIAQLAPTSASNSSTAGGPGSGPGDQGAQPPAGAHRSLAQVVYAAGAVAKPGTYARLPDMTVRDLLHQAGDVLPAASLQRAYLQRTNPDGTQGNPYTISLDKALKGDPDNNLTLQDEDSLVVLTTEQAAYSPERVVQITGAVAHPGLYPRTEDMRVSELVRSAGGITPSAATDRAFLRRFSPDGSMGPLIPLNLQQALAGDPVSNMILQDRDSLLVQTQAQGQGAARREVLISGAVQNPGSYPRTEGMTVMDLVKTAGGTLPTANLDNAYVQRVNPGGSFRPVIRLNLRRALAGDFENNFELQDQDSLTILTQDQPNFQPIRTAQVMGAVQNPGRYPISESETVRDVLHRAGGILPGGSGLQGSPMQGSGQGALIQHINPDGSFGKLDTIDLQKAMAGDAANNLAIEDRDVLTVLSQAQMATGNQALPLLLFGYDFFQTARQDVDARRRASAPSQSQTMPQLNVPLSQVQNAEAQAGGQQGGNGASPSSAPGGGIGGPAGAAAQGVSAAPPTPSLPTTSPFVAPAAPVNLLPGAIQWSSVLASTAERYQLGPGDTVVLRYWSPTIESTEVTLKVDSRGILELPAGAQALVRGLTVSQAENHIRRLLESRIRKVDLTLTLTALRSMSVMVAGESYAPGSYQAPATATFFNVLYASGGPTENGTLRRIQLKRTDGTTLTFDFYDFLLKGESTLDVPLQPGDVIFIPPVGSRVTIKGEVFRPAIFEIKDGERLHEAMRYSGGAKPSGVSQRVSIESYRPGADRTLIDANLESTAEADNPVLYNGDVVEVLSVRSEFMNAVSIEGAVDQPSRYAVTKGLTIADLVDRARGLLQDAYTPRADLFRQNPDKTQKLIPIDLALAMQRDPTANIAVEAEDRLVVYSTRDVQFTGYRRVDVVGAVRKLGSYYRADNMHVLDLLIQAGGLAPDASLTQAFLQRKNQDGTLGPLLRINLNKALANQPEDNIELRDRDVLTVFTVRQAVYTPDQEVRIMGAVQIPGTYPRAEKMRVQDLVLRAGSTLPNAAMDRAFLQRVNADGTFGPLLTIDIRKALASDPKDNVEMQGGDTLLIQTIEEADYHAKQEVQISGAVQTPGWYARAEKMRVSDLVRRAGDALPTAMLDRAFLQRTNPDGTFGPQLVVDLRKALDDDPENNVELQDNDNLLVQTKEQAQYRPVQMVDIEGPVQNPGKYPRAENMHVSDLLSRAGGVLPMASTQLEVAHARTSAESAPEEAVISVEPFAIHPDLLLKDGDLVILKGIGDYQDHPRMVTVLGEVKNPGPVILRGHDMRLSDVIREAGGLRSEAYARGAEFVRVPAILATAGQKQLAVVISKLNDQLNMIALGREKARSDVERIQAMNAPPVQSAGSTLALLGGNTSAPAAVTVLPPAAADRILSTDLVSPARVLTPDQFEPQGNVAINLPAALEHPRSDDDIVLYDGDTITIPEIPTTVTVVGAVIHSTAVAFDRKAKLGYYIDRAGGYTDDAARDRIVVIRPGGGLLTMSQVKSFEPGDYILVPTQVVAAKIASLHPSEVSTMLNNVMSTGISALVVKKLLGY